LGENATATKHGFEDGSSINEPELSSQSDAIDLELQAGLPPTVESRWGFEPVFLWAGRVADHAKRCSRAREPGLRRLERIRERRHLRLRQLLQWEAGESPNGTETCTLTTGACCTARRYDESQPRDMRCTMATGNAPTASQVQVAQ
jgi:hypothetical protein